MTILNMLSFQAMTLAIFAFFIIFPLYVGIQAWRKGRKAAAILTYLLAAIPFLGLLTALIVFIACRLWQPNLEVSPRLQNFSGCGTGFCGATDRAGDGSFLTTEWFKIFLIPIVPIQSYRVTFAGSSISFNGTVRSQTTQYYIIGKEKLKPGHIVRTYALLAGFYLVFFELMAAFSGGASDMNISGWQILVLCTAVVGFLVMAVRFWRAK